MKDCDVVKMSKCFWCGGTKDELILLGSRAKAAERKAWCENKSMTVIVNYEPCKKCQKKVDLGVWIIEVEETPNAEGQMPIQEGLYPTGNYWVVKKEYAKEAFDTDSDKVMVDKEVAEKLGLYKNTK